jgi:hypothetical protein
MGSLTEVDAPAYKSGHNPWEIYYYFTHLLTLCEDDSFRFLSFFSEYSLVYVWYN